MLYLFELSMVWEMRGAIVDSDLKDRWISIESAAEYLDVKVVTIRDWIKKDTGIPAHKIGKQWKFKLSELDEWVKSGKSAIE